MSEYLHIYVHTDTNTGIFTHTRTCMHNTAYIAVAIYIVNYVNSRPIANSYVILRYT